MKKRVEGDDTFYELKTAGYAAGVDVLIAETGRCTCGEIEDGVRFTHKGEAGRVVDYNDLIEFVELLKKERKEENDDG